jgi:hypothetical protein
MALSVRYQPPHPPGEACSFGLDFSMIIPMGVGIDSASLEIVTNTNPVESQSDWTQGTVEIGGRQVYAQCSGGVEGTDYQFRWTALDSLGNTWIRTALVLCAQTS